MRKHFQAEDRILELIMNNTPRPAPYSPAIRRSAWSSSLLAGRRRTLSDENARAQ
jgi:hypothetical protein